MPFLLAITDLTHPLSRKSTLNSRDRVFQEERGAFRTEHDGANAAFYVEHEAAAAEQRRLMTKAFALRLHIGIFQQQRESQSGIAKVEPRDVGFGGLNQPSVRSGNTTSSSGVLRLLGEEYRLR